MVPGEIFTSFTEFQGIVSVNDFRIPLRLQELLQAPLGVKFWFCTDTPGSSGWLGPAPRLLFGDCFEIRICHLKPCDLMLSSHQNFSARGTASPSRLLHGALVILVLLQISQFRSLGK